MGNRGLDDQKEKSIVPNVSLQSAMAHLGSDPPASIRDGDTEASVLSSRNGAKVSHIQLPPLPSVSGPRAGQLWSRCSAQERGTSHLPSTLRTQAYPYQTARARSHDTQDHGLVLELQGIFLGSVSR